MQDRRYAMTLREDLKNYVPMYLWEKIEHPEGFVITNEEYNMRWNLLQVQGDQQANAIRDALTMLYETVLNDEDGASHIRVDLAEYNADNLKGVLTLIDQRLKEGASNLETHKDSDDHDERYTPSEVLQSQNGASNIGNIPLILGAPYKLQATLEWLRQQINNTALGQVPDGSLSEIKMASDMRKDINGGVASFNYTNLNLQDINNNMQEINNDLITVDANRLIIVDEVTNEKWKLVISNGAIYLRKVVV